MAINLPKLERQYRLHKIATFVIVAFLVFLSLAVILVSDQLKKQEALVLRPKAEELATTTFSPIADAHVNSNFPNTNYGSNQILPVDGSPALLAYLKFDIKSLFGKKVTSAKLRLMVVSTEVSSSVQNAKGVGNNWAESTITYNNRPAPGNLLTTVTNSAAGSWIEANVTSYISAKVQNQNNLASLVLDDTTDSYHIRLNSREATSNAPQLVVKTSPLPPPPPVTKVCGDINGDQTWSTGIYYVSCNSKITLGSKVTIKSGVIVKIKSYLYVYGTLQTDRPTTNQISITSEKDDAAGGDTNGDGPSSGSPGDWSIIMSGQSSSLDLDNAKVLYGGKANGVIENKEAGNIKITNSTFEKSSKIIIEAHDSPSVIVGNSKFLNNLETPIDILNTNYLVNPKVHVEVYDNIFNNNGTNPRVGYGDYRWPVLIVLAGDSNGNVGTDDNWKISGNTGSGNGRNGIYLEYGYGGGNLSLGKNPGLAYVLSTYNSAGKYIKFEKGVVVKTAFRDGTINNTSHHIQGIWEAIGTPSEPIIFTSFYDDTVAGDTNGDGTGGSALQPQPGDWPWIWLEASTAQATFDNAIIRYGGSRSRPEIIASLVSSGGNLTIRNSRIESSEKRGIQALGGSIILENSVVSNNKLNAIDIRGGSDPANPVKIKVSNNTFNNNGLSGASEAEQYPVNVFFNQSGAESVLPNTPLFSGNTGSGNKYNGISLINSYKEGSWTTGVNANFPYIFSRTYGSNFTIHAGETIAFAAGSIIKFNDIGGNTSGLGVLGTLNAMGSSGSRAFFTSIRDDSVGGDTNADGSATAPGNDWNQITIASGGSLNFDYTTVLHGASQNQGCVGNGGGTFNSTPNTIICP